MPTGATVTTRPRVTTTLERAPGARPVTCTIGAERSRGSKARTRAPSLERVTEQLPVGTDGGVGRERLVARAGQRDLIRTGAGQAIPGDPQRDALQ